MTQPSESQLEGGGYREALVVPRRGRQLFLADLFESGFALGLIHKTVHLPGEHFLTVQDEIPIGEGHPFGAAERYYPRQVAGFQIGHHPYLGIEVRDPVSLLLQGLELFGQGEELPVLVLQVILRLTESGLGDVPVARYVVEMVIQGRRGQKMVVTRKQTQLRKEKVLQVPALSLQEQD